MIGRKSLIAAVLLGTAVLAAPTAWAGDPQSNDQKAPPGWEKSQKMLEEGAQRFIGALQMLLQAIPQYEMPEILPNGDILIRRKHPEKKKHHPPAPESDRT